MSDILITRIAPGVSVARTTDPFSMLEIHRIDRDAWKSAPTAPGIYLLYGFIDGDAAVYVGMSTTSIRDRVGQHHVNLKKNWFGTLFAVPLQSAMHCQAIEAEMIRRVSEAGVVGLVDNQSSESRFLDGDDVHVAPALDGITGALELLLGSDIFSPGDDEIKASDITPIEKVPLLARVYRGAAASPRTRTTDDPSDATHAWVGSGTKAWGAFEGLEPDTRFRVFKGSQFRRPTLDETQIAYKHQERVDKMQQALAGDDVIDLESLVFVKDHMFENWSRASVVVAGKGSYSGAYHWQLLA